jgi:hypothetical protein
MKDFSEALIEEYQPIIEKWEAFDAGWGPVKLWHSDSVSQFRSFLQNAAAAGIKGLRLSIADGAYLAARASELNHDNIVNIANEEFLITGNEDWEWSTCGFPKLADYDFDNFENHLDDDDDFFADYYAQRDAEYASFAGTPVLDSDTGELLWHHDGKRHQLVADCGNFEVALYNFYSQQFPEFKYGDHLEIRRNLDLFETSATGKALKPLIKRLYMTNM